MIAVAVYVCQLCETTWQAELPPLWTGFDLWPMCCNHLAHLVDEVSNLHGETSDLRSMEF